MKNLFYGSIVLAVIILTGIALNGNYLSYYKCMSQTKSETISKKGIDHVAAQCKTFILEKAMTN